ncbi:MAG: VWA domain-containing protein, partial [Candidatus Zapsychrus exili]|nr:VWA domain-containing protein [Candidatus Zapsychrus exili]
NPQEVKTDKTVDDMSADIKSEEEVTTAGQGATYISESLLTAIKSLENNQGGVVYLTTGDNIPDPYANKNVDQLDTTYRESLRKQFREEIVPALDQASLKTDGVEVVIVLQDSDEDSYFTELIKEYIDEYQTEGLRPRIHLKYSAKDETALSMFNFLKETTDFDNVLSLSDEKNYEGVSVNMMDVKGNVVSSYDLKGGKTDVSSSEKYEPSGEYDGYVYKKGSDFILPKSSKEAISRKIDLKAKDIPVALDAADANADIVYQVDISGSMKTNFDSVKDILVQLIKKTNVRGIMFFNSTSVWVTGSKEEMINQLKDIESEGFTNGDVATEKTIEHIANDIKRSVDENGNEVKLKYVNVSDLFYNGKSKDYVEFFNKLNGKNVELEYVAIGSAYQDIANTIKPEILNPIEVFKREDIPASVKNVYLAAAVNGSNGYKSFPVHQPGKEMNNLYESFVVYFNNLLKGSAELPNYYDLIDEVIVTEQYSGEFDWLSSTEIVRGSLYNYEQGKDNKGKEKKYITKLVKAGYIEKVKAENGRYVGRFPDKFSNIDPDDLSIMQLQGVNELTKKMIYGKLKKIYEMHRSVEKNYKVIDIYKTVQTLRDTVSHHKELGYSIKGISWSSTGKYIMPISNISDEDLAKFISGLVEEGYKEIELHSTAPKSDTFEMFPGKQDIVSNINLFSEKEKDTEQKDGAMITESLKPDKVGGIDLNPTHMRLKVRGQEIEFDKITDMQKLDLQNIEGLTPYIFNITPIGNVNDLIGFLDGEDVKESS